MTRRQRLLLGVPWAASWLIALPAHALGDGAGLVVSVQLNGAQDQRCISQTLSARTQAEVQVACSTGQFVDIEPADGKPFLGTQGNAFRYRIPFTSQMGGWLVANADAYLGAGTITALRIYNVNGSEGPVELLVSF
jgi:hypothetical protein